MSIINKIKNIFKKEDKKEDKKEKIKPDLDLKLEETSVDIKEDKSCEQYETRYNLLASMKVQYKRHFIEALETFDYAELLVCIGEDDIDNPGYTGVVHFMFNPEVSEEKRQEIKESTFKLFNITDALYKETQDAVRERMYSQMLESYEMRNRGRRIPYGYNGMPYAMRDSIVIDRRD